MKIAVVGSRDLTNIIIEKYIPKEATEIVSGGAIGIDSIAAEYAKNNNLLLTEFLPEYKRFGRAAPIIRNKKIVDYSDEIIIFWNGASKGTLSVIEYVKKTGKPFEVILCNSKTLESS